MLSECKQKTLALVVVFCMCFQPAIGLYAKSPESASADRPQRTIRQPVDIALDKAGALKGIVVDGNGKPKSAKVVLFQNGKQIAHAKASKVGSFQFKNVKGGLYTISTSSGICLCRFWTADAAPPAASSQIFIIDDPTIVRGQRPISELFRSDPVLMASIVAAAIVIPIAIHKTRDDSPSGS